jgi:hypothetical protein
MCASEMIEHRKNSWELYGFDFMVDDEYNAWLIEINSSPACDYSTTVTERYVQKALVELLSVVLDVREWETQPKKTRGERPNTGGWECIYQGPLLDMPVGAFGTEMSLKGEAYKHLPARSSGAAVNVSLQQVELGGVKGATSGMSTKLRTNVSLQSAQNHVSGESGPDSPQRAPRATVGRSTKAPAARRVAQITEETSPTSKDDEFDDSDGEAIEDKKKAKYDVRAGAAMDLAVSGTVAVKSTKSEAVAKGAVRAPPTNPAAVSIPIKVFSVDF